MSIPSNPDYGSLNLASAVQVFAYEIRMAGLATAEPGGDAADAAGHDPGRRLATADEVEGFFSHLERTLQVVDFIDPARPGRVLRRMRRLFARARPEEDEIHIRAASSPRSTRPWRAVASTRSARGIDPRAGPVACAAVLD